MRKILVGVLLIAACGSDPDAIDPGPDAGLDAAGPVDGVWRVAWACKAAPCQAPLPVGMLTLDVRGATLTYSGGEHPGSVVHVGAVSGGGGCVDVPAADEPHRHRNAYGFCLRGDGGEATIVWSNYDNPTAFSTWAITATR